MARCPKTHNSRTTVTLRVLRALVTHIARAPNSVSFLLACWAKAASLSSLNLRVWGHVTAWQIRCVAGWAEGKERALRGAQGADGEQAVFAREGEHRPAATQANRALPHLRMYAAPAAASNARGPLMAVPPCGAGDERMLRRLILDRKLAPCHVGLEEASAEREECPICMLVRLPPGYGEGLYGERHHWNWRTPDGWRHNYSPASSTQRAPPEFTSPTHLLESARPST